MRRPRQPPCCKTHGGLIDAIFGQKVAFLRRFWRVFCKILLQTYLFNVIIIKPTMRHTRYTRAPWRDFKVGFIDHNSFYFYVTSRATWLSRWHYGVNYDIIKPTMRHTRCTRAPWRDFKVGFIDHNSFYFMSPLSPLGSRGDAIVRIMI